MLLLSLWVLLLVVAVLNGYVREAYVTPRMGHEAAQIYGVTTLSAMVWLAAAFYARGTRGPGWKTWAGIAALAWVGLTVVFEFAFGHFVAGTPWRDMVRTYYFWEGQLWPIVLVNELVAPVVMGFRENR